MYCPHCQSLPEPDARFCGECGQILYSSKEQIESTANQSSIKIGRMRRPFWVGLTLFCSALLATLAFLVYERTRAVAYVNGEKISYSDWQSEVVLIKPLVESRYGAAVFQGAPGKENYKAFRYQVLQTLMMDRLLRQEAGRWGVGINEEEVKLRLTGMAKKEGQELKEFLKQQNLSEAQALRILRREILQERLINSQLGRQGSLNWEPSLYQQASQIYLSNLWSRAQIRLVDKELTSPTPKKGSSCACCGSSADSQANTGGCGTKSPQPLDPKIEQAARATALKAYREKYGLAPVMVAVTDYGCHIQMDIVDKGEILKSYAYREGKAEEIN